MMFSIRVKVRLMVKGERIGIQPSALEWHVSFQVKSEGMKIRERGSRYRGNLST